MRPVIYSQIPHKCGYNYHEARERMSTEDGLVEYTCEVHCGCDNITMHDGFCICSNGSRYNINHDYNDLDNWDPDKVYYANNE